MTIYNISKTYGSPTLSSDNAESVGKMFGVDDQSLAELPRTFSVSVGIKPGDVCYITGPTGYGKTTILDEISSKFSYEDKTSFPNVAPNEDRALIDCFDLGASETMTLLSTCGISCVYDLLHKPVELSSGRFYQYLLAKTLAAGKKVLLLDDFCSSLDRMTAAVTSLKIARYARKHDITLIVATSNDDLMADMQPDAIVMCKIGRKSEVIYKDKL